MSDYQSLTAVEIIDTQDRLYAEWDAASDALKVFPTTGPMGLTPDAVKRSPEYRAASARYGLAFAQLRKFNAK